MRWVLVLGAAVLAVFVAGRHYHWTWTHPSTYFPHGSPTVIDGGGNPAGAITPKQADRAVGRRATVCGTAIDVYYAQHSTGQPTFVDFGAPHPDEDFTIVIFGDDRGNFMPAPENWEGKNLCVTGLVKLYDDRPEIVARGPGQIRLSPN